MLIWAGFVLFVLAMLALDLGVFHRKPKPPSIPEALAWTAFWIILALAFNVSVYFMYENHFLGLGLSVGHGLTGKQAALQFLTGYLIEKSLSLDNIFVIALIFTYFGVELKYQHRLLFWGILGALVMRGVMIALGYALITRFWWVAYVFGVMLILTAVKLLVTHHSDIDPEKNPVVRLAKRLYPVAKAENGAMFTMVDGKRAVTPLFLALVMIESTDVLFALDSIPAIFAITRDPFIVFTSNVFAILGLRSLYFALAATLNRFRHLKTSLVFLLAFVGVKMILSPHFHMPAPVSLAVIGGILSVGVLASIRGAALDTSPLVSPIAEEVETMAQITYKAARKLVVIVIGFTLLIAGVVMIFLPGPAFIIIPLGLAVLAGEFVWARRLLKKARRTLNKQLNQSNK